MSEISIRYVSPHGRQEDSTFRDDTRRIELTMRAVIEIDLSAVEQCENLEVLELSHNFLESLDLEPLKHSKTLVSVRLRDNRLKELDLWPLHNSSSLSELDLTGNRLKTLDITPVFRCHHVQTDSTVVLTADSPLQYVLSPEMIMNQFHSVRTDRTSWTVTPIVMWNDYDDLVERMGWPAVLDRMKYILSETPKAHWFEVQKGFLEALGMRELSGLDTTPVRMLESVSANEDYLTSRERIYDTVVDLLLEQIERGGPTLFLDVSRMQDTRASKLIPSVLKHRQAEMEKLEIPVLRGTAFLHSLWLTSYGFDVVSALGAGLTVDSEGLKHVATSLQHAGYNLTTNHVSSVEHKSWDNSSSSFRRFVFRLARSGRGIDEVFR